MKKVLLAFAITLGLVSSASAKETLSVLFLFDRNTIKNSSSDRNRIADQFMEKLNLSFSNSSLDRYIIFRKKKVRYIPFAKKDEKIEDIKKRYIKNESDRSYYSDGKPRARKIIQRFQRRYRADVVIAIVNSKNDPYAGMAFAVPTKNHAITKKNTNILSYGDYGIVFLNYNNRELKESIAHEIGHSFGLFHGKRVQELESDNGIIHYDTTLSIKNYANGFASTDYGRNYGTIMAGRYVTSSEKGIDNKFSNKYSNTCGYYSDDEPCGDSTANAVKLIKENAKYYNKRGDWYR